MPRDVPEWIGRTADSRPPWSVIERLLEAAGHKCQGPCHQTIGAGNAFDVDHVVELKDWLPSDPADPRDHGNRESNLQLLCRRICHPAKTRIRAMARAVEKRKRKTLAGHKRPSRHPVPGSKASKYAKRYNRATGRFETVIR